jgi:hypothetical protein
MADQYKKQPRTEVININDMLKSIPIACSWCDKIYHIKQWQIAEGQRSGISHGMCPTCAEKQKKDLTNLFSKTKKKK